MVRVLLIRPGATEYDQQGRVQGTLDVPLCEDGRQEVEKMVEELRGQYDDEIDVCVRVSRLGRSSFDFAIEVFRLGELLVSGRLVYVNADPATRKAAPVPEFLRAAIKAFEKTPPVEAAAASA